MSDTNSTQPEEEEPIPDWISTNIRKITEIYHEDEGDLTIWSGEIGRRYGNIVEWYYWCVRQYPGTKDEDWADMASKAGEDVDIRLFMIGFPVAGYAILLCLEVCFAVDEALCDNDAEALGNVREWHIPQEMGAYKYLLSEEMILWWITELAELENELRLPSSNWVSLSRKINDLSKLNSRLEEVMHMGRGLKENIWISMNVSYRSNPPQGVHDGIYNRQLRLKAGVETLRKVLQPSGQEDAPPVIFPSSTSNPADSGGLRRRIPRASSTTSVGHDLDAAPTPIVNKVNNASASFSVLSMQNHSVPGVTLPPIGFQYLQQLFQLATTHVKKSKKGQKTRGISAWFVDSLTAVVISLCCIVISAIFMARSAMLSTSQATSLSPDSPLSDPNFLGNLSQSVLSNLTIYLIIITKAHSQPGSQRYRSWLWICLGMSCSSNVLGMILYYAVASASAVFLWVAAFAQVVIPILLIIDAGEAGKKNEDDVELHGL